MRLWHYKLIPFLPNSQLNAQWRELNSIFVKQDKHILINYVYEYSKQTLFIYSTAVISELAKRKNNGLLPKVNLNNFKNYFKDIYTEGDFYFCLTGWLERNWYSVKEHLFKFHHNDRYLIQCFYNLQEKYDRGQKDFDRETYFKLERFVEKEVRL